MMAFLLPDWKTRSLWKPACFPVCLRVSDIWCAQLLSQIPAKGQLSSGSPVTDLCLGLFHHTPALGRGGERDLCRCSGPALGVDSCPLASCSQSPCRGGCRGSSSFVPRKRPQLARLSHARSQWQHLAALSEVCLPESRCILGLPKHRKVFTVLPPRPGHRWASPEQTFPIGSAVHLEQPDMSCSFPFSPQPDWSSSCRRAVRAVLCPHDSRPLPKSVLQGEYWKTSSF